MIKKNREKTIEKLSEASKVPLEHMFNSHANCSAEWYFKTRSSEEGNTYNKRDNKFRCKPSKGKLHIDIPLLLSPTMKVFPLEESYLLPDDLFCQPMSYVTVSLTLLLFFPLSVEPTIHHMIDC